MSGDSDAARKRLEKFTKHHDAAADLRLLLSELVDVAHDSALTQEAACKNLLDLVASKAEVERLKGELDQCHRIHQPVQHIRAIQRAQEAEQRAEKAEADLEIAESRKSGVIRELKERRDETVAMCEQLLVELAAAKLEIEKWKTSDGEELRSHNETKRLLAVERNRYREHLANHETADAHDCARMEEMYAAERERAEEVLGWPNVDYAADSQAGGWNACLAAVKTALRPAAPTDSDDDPMPPEDHSYPPLPKLPNIKRLKIRPVASDPTPSEKEVMPDAGRRNSSSSSLQVVTGGGASGDHTPTEADLPLGHEFVGHDQSVSAEACCVTGGAEMCHHSNWQPGSLGIGPWWCGQPEEAHRRKP